MFTLEFISKKIERGIFSSYHFPSASGGELLYLRIFLPESNFFLHALPFPHELISRRYAFMILHGYYTAIVI